MEHLVKLLRDSYDLQEEKSEESAYWHLQKLRSEIKQLTLTNVSISLLKKYMQHVENCEGVNFVSDIGRDWSGIEFSKEEKALLEKLDAEIEQSDEC